MSILQEIKIMKEVANDDYVTISKIYFTQADKVKTGDAIIELESSKALFQIEAEKDGYIEYYCQEQEEIKVGETIIRIYDTVEDIHVRKAKKVVEDECPIVFSSAALGIIEKEKLNKNLFQGKDFVGIEDVKEMMGSKSINTTEENKNSKVGSSRKKDIYGLKGVDLKKIGKTKLLEIHNLADVQSANLTTVVSVFVNMENIVRFISSPSAVLSKSILPLTVFEVSRLLRKYPEFNSFFINGNIAFYKAVHIGLAIDIGYGLQVIKLKDADKKSFKEIEIEIINMINKYLDKKLTADDITGSTFTITDLSSEGVDFFIPLVNKEQSAILGISSYDSKLNRCTLSLTFDHRVTEGKKAAIFLNELKKRLESYDNSAAAIENKQINPKSRHCYRCLITLKELKERKASGLLKIIDCDGNEKYLCELCFAGW